MADDPALEVAIAKLHQAWVQKRFRAFLLPLDAKFARPSYQQRVKDAFDAAFGTFIPNEQELLDSIPSSKAGHHRVGKDEWNLAVSRSAAGRNFEQFVRARVGKPNWEFTEGMASVARDYVAVEPQ
jgi:hypothetical protein